MKTMWHLIKKFSFFFILYFVIYIGAVFPAFNYDRLTSPDPFSLVFPMYLIPYLFMVVLASFWIHEQIESKTSAYAFLSTLPINAKEIVVAKFTLVFCSVCLYTIFHCTAFFLISRDPHYLNPACSFLIINACICLLFSALFYLGIFRYGFAKFGKYVLLAWIVIIISPIPIFQFLLPRLGISRLDIITQMTRLSWPLVVVVSIVIYLGLTRVAIKTLKTAEGYGG